jgi:hypothetical protein
MSDDIRAYTGFWINWSRGAVYGTTLTLEHHSGAILAAFLALYVSFAGGAFWRLLSFVLHQLKTTEPPLKRDIQHHQCQVILRNSGTSAVGAAQAFATLTIRDWGKATKPNLSSLFFTFLAVSTALVFVAAGIFTSAVTRIPGNATIILGPSCGGFDLAWHEYDGLPQNIEKQLADVYAAATYVRQCYQQNVSRLACGTYVQPRLPFTENTNASCPFSSGMCFFNDKSAFSMDTGFLNSHHHFGINAPPKDRILYRRVTTCAPIHTRYFGVDYNDSVTGETVLINAGSNAANWTFRYVTRAMDDGIGYMLK